VVSVTTVKQAYFSLGNGQNNNVNCVIAAAPVSCTVPLPSSAVPSTVTRPLFTIVEPNPEKSVAWNNPVVFGVGVGVGVGVGLGIDGGGGVDVGGGTGVGVVIGVVMGGAGGDALGVPPATEPGVGAGVVLFPPPQPRAKTQRIVGRARERRSNAFISVSGFLVVFRRGCNVVGASCREGRMWSAKHRVSKKNPHVNDALNLRG
jgi:hypothetical protein